MLNALEFALLLEQIGACEDARNWCCNMTPQEAWDRCERPDWMRWWASRTPCTGKQWGDIWRLSMSIPSFMPNVYYAERIVQHRAICDEIRRLIPECPTA